MVLGAGPAQVPGIRKAVTAGHRVVTVDPFPDSPGHAHSHGQARCDTRDTAAVLAAAARLQVDGLCTFRSDVATLTVHRVRASLGLPGGYPHAAETMAHKGLFREFQEASGLPCPRFVHGADPEALRRRAMRLVPAIFCKPVDNCGSRGVSRIEGPGGAGLEAAIAQAMACSRTGSACVEERIPGVEFGGDAVLSDGAIVFLAITEKHVERLVPTGHRLPCGLSEVDNRRIEAALESACARLGYRDGPLNFDVMLDESAVTIIEMSPRNGGNGLTDLIRHACAADVERMVVDLALGVRPEPPRPTVARGFGVAVLGSAGAGRIGGLPTLADWQKRCPNAVEVFYGKAPGDRAEAFVHSANAIGHVVFRCADRDEFERVRRRLTSVDLLEP